MTHIAASPRSQEQLAAWFAFCAAHPGALPPDVTAVQSRLIRAVGRARLPEGREVFLKAMGFPRPRDRLRYWLRALPAQHEARMLRAVAAAGIPCPRVVGVLGRRGLLGAPRVSVLATDALDLLPGAVPRLLECSVIARRLADAGIWHPDLHERNFVQIASGGAVLDLQSARHRGRPLSRGARVRLAGRLLAAEWPEPEVPDAVVRAGLVDSANLAAAVGLAQCLRADAIRRRVDRCMMESTEFSVVRRPWGALVQRRALRPGGVWRHGGRELIRIWLGARLCEIVDHEPPTLGALFLNSWWFPRRCSVYIPAADGAALFDEHCARWQNGFGRLKNMTGGGRCDPALMTEGALPWTGRREL